MKEYLSTLNPEQFEAATTIDGSMLVLAGAGAGKTHTMITRVAHMIEEGIDPRSILLLTFTNKAAEEMVERAIRHCGDAAEKITACTYHSFCNRMLRQYGKAIGLKEGFDILTPTQAIDAIGFVKAKSNHSYSQKGFPPNRMVASIFSAVVNYSAPLDVILRKKNFSKYQPFKDQLELLSDEYQEYKLSKNIFDYDDLMVYFYRLLTTIEPVRKQIEETYRYIMVDEYQDTNDLQSKILEAMRRDCKNIAIVGDDAQSIYAFRGANVQNIIDFPNQYVDCKQVQLTENYRSSNEILQLANDSYENYATEGFPKRMKGQFDAGFKPLVMRPFDTEQGNCEVFEGIKQLIASGVSPDEICVISRTSRSFFALEQMLNGESIPYEKRGGMKFLELEEVLDMIAYLRASANEMDELSLFRLLQRHPGVGETYARRICDLIGVVDNPLVNNKYKNFKYAPELRLLHDTLIESRKIPNEEPIQKFKFFEKFYIELQERVIAEMNTDEGTRTELFEAFEEKKVNLKEMLALIEKHPTVTAFLDALVLDQSRVSEDDLAKVVLTTIHSVKGLEFDSVFLLGCVDGVFPRGQRWEVNDEEQEELRCFYVAVTRAKKRLYIVAPKTVAMYGKLPMQATLTRFLDNCEHTYNTSDYFELL